MNQMGTRVGLTTKAQPWPSVEREVSPADILQRIILPPFRSKLIRILAIEVSSPVHNINTVPYGLSGPDENRCCPVRSAARRKSRHSDGFSRVDRHRRIKSQYFA